jgi:hypothetical protein
MATESVRHDSADVMTAAMWRFGNVSNSQVFDNRERWHNRINN